MAKNSGKGKKRASGKAPDEDQGAGIEKTGLPDEEAAVVNEQGMIMEEIAEGRVETEKTGPEPVTEETAEDLEKPEETAEDSGEQEEIEKREEVPEAPEGQEETAKDSGEPEETEKQEEILETTVAEGDDRMMRYKDNPRCPECGSFPVVCLMKRPGYGAYRCRVRTCRHVFEVKN